MARGRRLRPLYSACIAAGWEEEDLRQELALRVLDKQGEGSTYDPERAGVGTYLERAVRGLLQHMLDERRTLKVTRIRTGALGPPNEEGERTVVDAALVAIGELEPRHVGGRPRRKARARGSALSGYVEKRGARVNGG